MEFGELDDAKRAAIMAEKASWRAKNMMRARKKAKFESSGHGGSGSAITAIASANGNDSTSSEATTGRPPSPPPPTQSEGTVSTDLRSGRWTNEESAYCDNLIRKFMDGRLPLPDGVKLNEFLSNMLRSKQSRLTKKMKNAKLSSKTFKRTIGCLADGDEAREFSEYEDGFFHSIQNGLDRAEIKFHMQKEWRETFSTYCVSHGQPLNADRWLASVEEMDRRVQRAKEADRVQRRQMMMGNALRQDLQNPDRGVVIDNNGGGGGVNGKRESTVSQSDDGAAATTALVNTNNGQSCASSSSSVVSSTSAIAPGYPSTTTTPAGAASSSYATTPHSSTMVDNMTSTSSNPTAYSSIARYSSSNNNNSDHQSMPDPMYSSTTSTTPKDLHLATTVTDCSTSSQTMASPFLHKIVAFMHRHLVPFEYIDAWVPSFVPESEEAEEASVLDGKEEAAQPKCRLCFAGSMVTKQVILGDGNTTARRAVPLSADDQFNLSAFGDYSESFSFDVGCGLPGRVYHMGVPTWEQSVHNAPLHHFERVGGSQQWGIRTVVGIPVPSPNVGRVVVVLYSRHDRAKDHDLVIRLTDEFTRLMPSPKWKLIVDVGDDAQPPQAQQPPITQQQPQNIHQQQQEQHQQQTGGVTSRGSGADSDAIADVISIFGEHMPSDPSSPSFAYLQGFMSLRLLLLRTSRTEQEQDIVNTILSSYSSYKAGGRTRSDMALMLARDFVFLTEQSQQAQQMQAPQVMRSSSQQMMMSPYTQMMQQPSCTVHYPTQQQHPAPLGNSDDSGEAHFYNSNLLMAPQQQTQQQQVRQSSSHQYNHQQQQTQDNESDFMLAEMSASPMEDTTLMTNAEGEGAMSLPTGE